MPALFRRLPQLQRRLSCALALLLLPWLTGCSESDALTTIKQEDTLKVITRNGPTTYYENRGSATGFEYVLAEAFADFLGVELEIIPVYGLDELFDALQRGRVHLAAAGLTVTPERQKTLEFGPSYMDVRQFVIYRRGNAYADRVEDLIGKRIRVIASSSHVEVLSALQQQHPELSWEEARNLETIDLLEQLENDDIDFTIIDSNEYIANRGFYPQHRVAFSIGEPGQLGWALANGRDNSALREQLDAFFTQARDNGQLASWVERFYGHSESNTQINSQTFVEAMRSRLPTYREMIEQVALEYEMDWRLLAAMSYQESHWNPRAVSPTGVKGMMMLTRRTAKEMGVTYRFDALQSLRGGARYFRKIRQRLPASIKNPDRSWFAMAAYNVGFGHLEDARVLTEKQGGNPNLWKDVKERLPLLRQKKYYKQTRYGYARGDEPVHYVQNIRHYYSLLTWTELAKLRTPPPKIVQDYVPAILQRGFEAL